ncbi:MAG: transglycosylase domain-containing protein, partial [Alphaproteobacteria bacterium]|nr:transglycosylase domain-containing protein [Alphaproteobacteria bacterium]
MRLLANLAALFFMLAIIAVLAVSYVVYYYGKDLPDTQQLAEYDPPMVTRLYAGDGRLVAEYATEKRSFVPVKAIPKHVLQAFISAEDKNFYEHSGIDFMGMGRAILQNVETISQGRDQNLVGGSTITQQVVKNFLLTNEKSVERKIKEAILSFRISKVYSKDRILELYMNQIYLGFNSYGVAAAALNYFNKSLDELTLEEAAFLAVLPKAPNNYNPRVHYDRAKERRDWVIGRMLEDGYVTVDEAKLAIATPIVTRTRDETETATAEFFAEEVRRQLIEQYGSDTLYKGGLAVRTTLDPNLQGIAQRAMREALESYDQRHGYRGPVAQVASLKYWQDGLAGVPKPPLTENWKLAVVLALKANAVELGLPGGNTGIMPFENMKWARKWLPEQRYGAEIAKPSDALKPGDVILVEEKESEGKVDYFLRQVPQVNGAMVVMDPFTGRVLAMVGGYGYGVTEFNRATQARRQPGSAFKPFVYVTALERGFTPSSIILDAPVELSQGPGQPMWRPENYTGKFYGPSTLRKGVEHSRNAMTVRLALRLGIDNIIETATRAGIYDKVPRNFSLVLGAAETTLLRLTNAYAIIANGGRRVQPALIERI